MGKRLSLYALNDNFDYEFCIQLDALDSFNIEFT